MSQVKPIISQYEEPALTLRGYVTGFVSSLVLTGLAYLSVQYHWLHKNQLISFIVGLALVQFLVQLAYFLHLKAETKPRWKLFVLVFMLGIVIIIVFGSLWIMNNLNYRMTPRQQEQYLKTQDGGL